MQKTRLLSFSHIVSRGRKGQIQAPETRYKNALDLVFPYCFRGLLWQSIGDWCNFLFLAPGNNIGKRAQLRFPILFLGVYIRRYFGDVWGGIPIGSSVFERGRNTRRPTGKSIWGSFWGRLKQRFPYLKPARWGHAAASAASAARSHGPPDGAREPCACFPDDARSARQQTPSN